MRQIRVLTLDHFPGKGTILPSAAKHLLGSFSTVLWSQLALPIRTHCCQIVMDKL